MPVPAPPTRQGASRAHGARSHGRVTAAGKDRSAKTASGTACAAPSSPCRPAMTATRSQPFARSSPATRASATPMTRQTVPPSEGSWSWSPPHMHERFRAVARSNPSGLSRETSRTNVWSAPLPQGLVGLAKSRRRECIRPFGMRLVRLGPLWDRRVAGLVTRAASGAVSFDRLVRRRSTVVAMSSLAEQNSCAVPGR